MSAQALVDMEGDDMTDDIQTDYVQFQFPDLPFSAFRIALSTDVEWAMGQAQALADGFRETFPAASQPAPAADSPPGAHPAADARPAGSQAAQGSKQWAPGTGKFCPACEKPSGGLIEVQFSAAKYQDERQDKWTHPFPPGQQGPEGGKWHTVWTRLLVDAEGQLFEDEAPSDIPIPPEPEYEL